MYGSISRTDNRMDNEGIGPKYQSYVEPHCKTSVASNDRTFQNQISLPALNSALQHEPTSETALLIQGHPEISSNRSETILSCIVNLANTIIGAGMLGLPGALAGTGYFGGTIFMVLAALFSANGLLLLSKAAQQSDMPSSFYSVAKAAIPRYTILIDLAVTLKCFGVATGYLITISDCMVDALDHILKTKESLQEKSFFTQSILSRQFWVVTAVLAVLPVSFYKTLGELKRASALALIFVLFLALGIVAYAHGWADPCYDQNEQCRGELEAFTDAERTISKVPIFVFAFTCHQNIFPIVNEIEKRTQPRLNAVIALSIGLSFCLFLLVAMEGYRTFGSNVQGDIVLNYPETGNVTILRICIAFMLTLHYPLQLDPSRRCINSLLQALRQERNNRVFHGRHSNLVWGQHCHPESCMAFIANDIQFFAITVSFLLSSFCVAMMVDDLGVVLAMVGATGSTLVSYILPGLIYIKINAQSTGILKVGAYIQLFLGFFIMPVALYFVLFSGEVD